MVGKEDVPGVECASEPTERNDICKSGVTTLTVVFALLLIVILLVCLVLTMFGLPGNWLILAVTSVYASLTSAQSAAAIGWKPIVVLFVLAVLGEILELLAATVGTAKAGGSRRGAALALAGSFVGAVVGIFIGIPVPLIGPILAALLFAGLGALAGAMMGERWAGKDWNASWRIGKAAFGGRLAGTLGKILLGGAMLVVVIVALLW
jgi:uncharacterized protein